MVLCERGKRAQNSPPPESAPARILVLARRRLIVHVPRLLPRETALNPNPNPGRRKHSTSFACCHSCWVNRARRARRGRLFLKLLNGRRRPLNCCLGWSWSWSLSLSLSWEDFCPLQSNRHDLMCLSFLRPLESQEGARISGGLRSKEPMRVGQKVAMNFDHPKLIFFLQFFQCSCKNFSLQIPNNTHTFISGDAC